MIDFLTQASPVASAVPHASMYADPGHVPNIVIAKPAQTFDPASRFDGRMHGRIKAAQTEVQWIELGLILANAYDNKNLRPGVRHHFFEACPHPAVLVSFKVAIGWIAPEEKKRQEKAAADKAFDERMILNMKQGKWESVYQTLCHAWENGNLRKQVWTNFLRHCPDDYVGGFTALTRDDFGPVPTRPVKLSRAQQDARTQANRDARLASRPARGKDGQKSKPQSVKGKK